MASTQLEITITKQKPLIVSRWHDLLGMGKEFSKGDRILAIAYAGWTLSSWLVFVVVSIAHFVYHCVPDSFWPKFWHVYILVIFAQSIPGVVWFTVGGILDVKAVLKALREAVRDPLDDGQVRKEAAKSEELTVV